MPNLLIIIFFWLLLAAAPALAADNNPPAHPADLNREDRKVVTEMEILQLMDLAREMNMVDDMKYLIGDDQNEKPTD